MECGVFSGINCRFSIRAATNIHTLVSSPFIFNLLQYRSINASGVVLQKAVLSALTMSHSSSFIITSAFLHPRVALVMSSENMVAISFAVRGQLCMRQATYTDAAITPSRFNPLNVLCSEMRLWCRNASSIMILGMSLLCPTIVMRWNSSYCDFSLYGIACHSEYLLIFRISYVLGPSHSTLHPYDDSTSNGLTGIPHRVGSLC